MQTFFIALKLKKKIISFSLSISLSCSFRALSEWYIPLIAKARRKNINFLRHLIPWTANAAKN
jgi:hypothetical protein